jgi:hypothetical protein
MSIDRRNFLSMMAALPLVAKSDGWIPSSVVNASEDKKSDFYVWVHGVFGMTLLDPNKDNQNGTLRLVCPNLYEAGNEHEYWVGRVKEFNTKPANVKPISKNSSEQKGYSFVGLPDTNVAKSAKGCPGFPTLCGTLKDKYDGYFFTLPRPTSFLALRGFSVESHRHKRIKGRVTRFSMPMVHVFRYENVVANQVRICSVENQQDVLWQNDDSVHLHLFVEPKPVEHNAKKREEDSLKHDPNATLEALRNCYNGIASFTLKGKEECPRLDNISGFCDDLKEQFFLYEWRQDTTCQVGPAGVQYTFTAQGCPQFWISEP